MAEHPRPVHAPACRLVRDGKTDVLLTASAPTVVLPESSNPGTTSNATHMGWECHSAFGEGNRRRKGFWMQRLCTLSAGRNLLKLLQRFLSYFQ